MRYDDRERSYGGRSSGGRGSSRGESRGGRYGDKDKDRDRDGFTKRKVRRVGQDVISKINYKNVDILKNFISEKGKVLPRRIIGFTSKEQRKLARAIKRARHAGLLHFQAE